MCWWWRLLKCFQIIGDSEACTSVTCAICNRTLEFVLKAGAWVVFVIDCLVSKILLLHENNNTSSDLLGRQHSLMQFMFY